MIFEMYDFFIVINIGPCHGNPKLLPTLVPYWIVSRHSPKNPRWVVCQTKMDKWGTGNDFDM